MKALISRTSDFEEEVVIIDTLQDLLDIVKKEGYRAIVDIVDPPKEDYDFTIEIYDDYRE